VNKTIPTTFTVSSESNGQRLDVFLAEKLAITRSQVQKLIAQKQVTINSTEPKKTGERVNTTDTVTISNQSTSQPINVSTNQPLVKKNKKNPTPPSSQISTPELKILAETPDYLIINKPTGLLTHQVEHTNETSVADILVKKYPELAHVGDSSDRPGIVHRLDKEASGLLIIPRTPEMFNHLKEQFKNRTIDKEYLVLVHDPVAREEGTIDFPIARSENAERMAAIPQTEKGHLTDDGKVAKTDFLVEKYFVNFTLLRVKIHTGRTHQIRVHMLAYNHPVVGDPLYTQKKRKRTWDEKLGRLFLHCTKLGFTDLNGIPQEFESPLPPELQNFLTTLA
jgi:23S rRNA pseudouridine1911/1915/1917 synthase